MLKQKKTAAITAELENLPLKKTWKINADGKKIKVVRKAENCYESYLDGHYITSDEDWQTALQFVLGLLSQK
jgi:hypothetical protein